MKQRCRRISAPTHVLPTPVHNCPCPIRLALLPLGNLNCRRCPSPSHALQGIVMHSDRFTLRADHVLALDGAAPPSQIGNIDAAVDCLDASCQGTGPSCDTAAILSYATGRAHPYLPNGAPYWSHLAAVGGWAGGCVQCCTH